MTREQPPSPDQLFGIDSPERFEELSLAVFRFQGRNCKVYREYLSLLGLSVDEVYRSVDIPFLPIELFKSHYICTSASVPQIVFTSSGTTGSVQSKHHILNVSIYERSFRSGFEHFYGSPKDLAIVALLPAYAERTGSSLIYMVDDLIRQTSHPLSGYFLYNHDALYQVLKQLEASNVPTLLIGVTFALLDFAEHYQIDFPTLIVMETGGMKGRRDELIREEVHEQLRAGFHVSHIHSEYGMTELLSQAYSKGEGLFQCPPWMDVRIRDTNDPFDMLPEGRTGAINVIDLANLHSCSFIATQDLGKQRSDGYFEVLGRFDNSDIRGCNLLVQ